MDANIPEQEQGAAKDFRRQVTMETAEDAEDMFLLAKERLLNVNEWKNIIDGNSAEFQLCDHHGHPLLRHAHLGDYVKIDLPGPGPLSGGNSDWVHIEKVIYDDYPDENGETISIQLRPTSAPDKPNNETAHFFTDASTSTIQIKRWGKIVAAYYHGRNELPNTETDNVFDKVRNLAVATTAIVALSSVQWTNLLDGLLKEMP
ncbi:MAG: hypothetical protein EOP51_04155 [Sphingobacteriales bacterium]|nr:MAG: hypothetical protein EOP51_04155 [Sphingobacteriales bacterium]